MTLTTIQSTRDRNLYANLSPTEDGEVRVQICRRAGYRGACDPGMVRILGEMTIDAPFHAYPVDTQCP